MTEREVRQRKRRRMIARKRKRRRQIISISLLAIIIIFIITRIFSFLNRSEDDAISPALMWYYTNTISKEIPEKLYYSPEYLSNISLKPLKDIEKEYIVKGSNHLAKASGYAYDAKEIREFTRNNNYEGNKKLVFLTFDDGPNTTISPQVLKTLKDNNVHATFFLVGRNITEKTSHVLRDILSGGNSIATHSFTHDYEYLYPERIVNSSRVYGEIEKTNVRLKKYLGDNFNSDVFRYPGGEMSWNNTSESNKYLEERGIHWIDWNCLIGDAEKKSVRPTTAAGFVEYVDKTLNKNKNTKIAVVLMHDAENKQLTADSLNEVIKYFRDRNYEFGVLR